MRKLLVILLAFFVIAAALLAAPYIRYRRTAGMVPGWVQLGGLQVHGATQEEVITALNRGLEEPVEAYIGSQRALLRPEAVGFRVDVVGMIAQARQHDTFDRMIRYLVETSLERDPTLTDIPLRYTLDAAALEAWVADVAARTYRAPQPPLPLLQELTLAPGKPGIELDVTAAREQVLAALANPSQRTVYLTVHETPAPPLDIAALGTLLEARLEQFPGIGSVWLHYLPTGEEIAINADVAYAGSSTLKIAIMTQLFRVLDGPPDLETRTIISQTMELSSNFTANLMLGILGDGDWNRGVTVMNQAFKTLGLHNTFMAAPYDRKLPTIPRIVTEANSRSDINTQPDPYMQTTPRDIGSSLQMLVACSQGGGTLIAAYDDRITPEECQQALSFLALNEMTELIVAGLPPDAKAVHKHGYVPDSHGDVAAIWSPAGPYVLTVFLHRPVWLEWHFSNPTMQELSRAAWNFFETYRVQDQAAGVR